MLRLPEQEAWRKTPYQIMRLFRLHKEYNPQQFGEQQRYNTTANGQQLAPIDIALGGL